MTSKWYLWLAASIVSLPILANPPGQGLGSALIWNGFPNYLDPETSNRVYQISVEPGMNRTFYYHQARFRSADWVVYENLPPQTHRLLHIQVNLRTGAREIIASNRLSGAYFGGTFLGGFERGDGTKPPSVAWFDLSNRTWATLHQISPPWTPDGALAVSGDRQFLIYTALRPDAPGLHRVILVNLTTSNESVLYEGRDDLQHFYFSPTRPALFTYINQSAKWSLARLGMGDARQGTLGPLVTGAPDGTPLSASNFLGANFAHPFWSPNGMLWSDVLWHRQSPDTAFYLAGFDFTDVGGAAKSAQIISVPGLNWNEHSTPTPSPHWFVGDGDPFPVAGPSSERSERPGSPAPNKVPGTGLAAVNLYRIPPITPSWDPQTNQVRVVRLATMRGGKYNPNRKRPVDLNSHWAGGGDGLLTTWLYRQAGQTWEESPFEESQVFFVAVPPWLKQEVWNEVRPLGF